MSASDWMKMRTNLWDDPRVGAIADETGTGEAAVIGALYWLWATADEHSTDGLLAGMTLRQIDRKTGVSGFAAALAKIGWVEETEVGVQISRFEEHNGKSAKRRASESVRKMSARDADKDRTNSGSSAHLEVEVEKEEDQKKKAKAGARSPTGSRLPADWEPSEADRAYAQAHGVDPSATAENFRDYWSAAAGAKARKADWGATWRTWVRREAESKAGRGGATAPTRSYETPEETRVKLDEAKPKRVVAPSEAAMKLGNVLAQTFGGGQ